MSELTIAATAVRALMEFAVSRGASRSALSQRSQIDPADLADRDNRIPFAKYVTLMRAGVELCNDPALALHFGEAVDGSEISITHHIGARSVVDAMAVINRYAALTVVVDQDGSDRYVFSRSGGQFSMVDTRKNANDFPELTESSFARMICTMRPFLAKTPFVKAVHVTHAAPSYRAEYDRIFRVPVVFESNKNAFLMDDAVLSFTPPIPDSYVSEVLTALAEV